MATTPLMFRVSAPGAAPDVDSDSAVTLQEPLPSAVETEEGVVMQTRTRVTEVQRETTDDK